MRRNRFLVEVIALISSAALGFGPRTQAAGSFAQGFSFTPTDPSASFDTIEVFIDSATSDEFAAAPPGFSNFSDSSWTAILPNASNHRQARALGVTPNSSRLDFDLGFLGQAHSVAFDLVARSGGPAGLFVNAYRVTVDGSLGIAAMRPLTDGEINSSGAVLVTPLLVVPDNQTRAYGQANLVLTGTIIGLLNNDNITANYSTVADATSQVGNYPITAALSDPDNKLGNYTVQYDFGTLNVTPAVQPGTVVGRMTFYNNSSWDISDPTSNADDDRAIAPDKMPLRRGGIATFANYTSYNRGLNGIMIDLVLPSVPTASDFTFKVGNSDAPGTWVTAPAPSSVTVRTGVGAQGADRVTIIWPDNAIQRQWLEVTVLATANTGLSSPDVFYFGNAIGECGNSGLDAKVNPADELLARLHQRDASNPAPIIDVYDFNRDEIVDHADELIAQANQTSVLTALKLIDLSVLATDGTLSGHTSVAGVSPATTPGSPGSPSAPSGGRRAGQLVIRSAGQEGWMVEFLGALGGTDHLEVTEDLEAGQWRPIYLAPVPLGGAAYRWTIPRSPTSPTQFYRLASVSPR